MEIRLPNSGEERRVVKGKSCSQFSFYFFIVLFFCLLFFISLLKKKKTKLVGSFFVEDEEEEEEEEEKKNKGEKTKRKIYSGEAKREKVNRAEKPVIVEY